MAEDKESTGIPGTGTPKTPGAKMLNEAYSFLKELRTSAIRVEDDLTKAIFQQDLDAARACWRPDLVHYRQKEYGLTYLHLAVMAGNLEMVKFLAEQGADVDKTAYSNGDDTRNFCNLSCLHLAVLCCHKPILGYLLEKHSARTEQYVQFRYEMKKKYKRINGMTPFHYAIFWRDMDTLDLLARHNASVGASTSKGYTSVHLAAMLNCDDVLQYLLNDKSFKCFLSKDDITPLIAAAASGAHKPLETLISRGYDVNTLNKKGVSPLHVAAASGKRRAVDVLVAAGADVKATCKKYKVKLKRFTNKHGVLYNASPLHVAIATKKVNCLKALLESGADPNACCDRGGDSESEVWHPLHLAVQLHSQQMCDVLLKHGAEVNAQDEDGTTPLLQSIIEGDLNVVKLLLQQKDVDVTISHTPSSFSPLITAIVLLNEKSSSKSKDMDMICSILNHPTVDIEQKYVQMHRHDVTALHMAVHKGSKEVVEILLDKGASVNTSMSFPDSNTFDVSLMHTLATQGYDHLVDVLHKAGVPLDLQTNKGITPLLMAVVMDFRSLTDFFLDQGADPNGGSGEVTALMLAAEHENIPLMQKLMRKGCDLNRKSNTGRTALHLALFAGSLVAAHLLIDYGCDISIRSDADETTLALAIEFADVRFVERLLKKGADPNETFTHTNPGDDADVREDNILVPLHLAARHGKLEAMKILLKHGAKINGSDENGMTSLFEALSNKQNKAAAFLIQKGAHLNHKLKRRALFGNSWHQEIFSVAISSGATEQIVDLLVDFGVQIALPNSSSSRLPHTSIPLPVLPKLEPPVFNKLLFHGVPSNQNLLPILQDENLSVIKAFLQRGVELTKFQEELFGALGEKSSTDILSLFIQSGLDLSPPENGPNLGLASGPVMFLNAARLGHLDVLKVLIKSGVSVNFQGKKGLTALHWAAFRRHKSCVRFLVQQGASVHSLASLNGYRSVTPLHAAVMSNTDDIIDDIVVAGADIGVTCYRNQSREITPLMVACYSECLNSLSALATGYGCDVNRQNSAGETALHIVIQSQIFLKRKFFKILMCEGPDVSITTQSGLTPLMAAVKHQEIEIAHQLIHCGEGVNTAAGAMVAENDEPFTSGRTPLHYAASLGNVKLVKMLIEAGADLDKTEVHILRNGGYTPLHNAVSKGHLEVIPILVKAGCNINAQTSKGYSALHMAAKKGYMDVTKKLMDLGINPKLKTKTGETPSNLALFPTIARLLVGYEAAWDLKHRRPTLQRKRFSLQQRLSMQKIEAFSTESFMARENQEGEDSES